RISTKDDVIVSFHLNSVDYNEGNGVEVFYYPTSQKGKELAKIMLEANLKVTKLKNRGVKPNVSGARGHALFQKTKATAVLIESGFISNDRDIATLNAVQEQLGKSYAQAIAKYLKG
ncbi:N-acetylmuramoyl-L-alanine amidase, partial [Sebaldella sp. S0638]|uniref:N-acetylmuramoyl-L-alanine amidase family protein n=1 Tax=Sebaldella sp. S0638 TaxID=2957809 RepID=UPI00209F5612